MAAEGYPGLTVNLSFGIQSGAAGITCDATLPASGAECLLAPGTVRRLSTVDALALSDGAEDAFLDGRGKRSPARAASAVRLTYASDGQPAESRERRFRSRTPQRLGRHPRYDRAHFRRRQQDHRHHHP